MRPIDHRGREVWGEAWDRMYFYGGQLLERGYMEAKRKPNLFFLAYPQVAFFASLCGTKEIAPWEDHRPIFWWRVENGVRLETDVLARMVTIEATRLNPIPIRRTYRASEESLEIFMRVEDEDVFDRPEPERVPKAPYISRFSGRLHMYEAIDGQTEERIRAGSEGSDRTYLRCPLCSERVTREWDPDLQRFFFDHRKGRCAMHHYW